MVTRTFLLVLFACLAVLSAAVPLEETFPDIEQTFFGSEAAEHEPTIEEICGGFAVKFVGLPNLYYGAYILPDHEFELRWVRGGSQVFEFFNLELLQEGTGLVADLWQGKGVFNESGEYTMNLKLSISTNKLNNRPYMLRSWGNSEIGGHCTAYSAAFFTTEELQQA